MEEERSQVREAQLKVKQLTSKIKEAFAAKEWTLVQNYKQGFDAAWAVLKRSEPVGGWEERWYSLKVEASLLFGKAMGNLGRWGAVETVVGRPGEKARVPKVGDEGYSSEKIAEWLILRARARAAEERWEAAFYDLQEAEVMAGRGRRWLLGEAEKTRKQVERMKREAEERKEEKRRRSN